MPTPRLFTTLFLCLAILVGCGQGYHRHLGSVDLLDSQAYDALSAAQIILDGARDALDHRQLPSTVIPVLDTAITAYNTTRTAWLAYRAVIQSHNPPEPYNSQLVQDVAVLNDAINILKEVK